MTRRQYINPVPDAIVKPKIDRLRCKEHGVITHTITVTEGGMVNDKGRFDRRTGNKVQVCLLCLAAGVVSEVGR